MPDFIFFRCGPKPRKNSRAGNRLEAWSPDESTGIFRHYGFHIGAGSGKLGDQIDRLVRSDSAADTQQNIQIVKHLVSRLPQMRIEKLIYL